MKKIKTFYFIAILLLLSLLLFGCNKSIMISVIDSNGGSVNISSGKYESDSVIDLIATPMEGYEFCGWYVNNQLLSIEKTYKYKVAKGDVKIEAKFEIISCNLRVTSTDGGSIVNVNGDYNYGSEILLKATAEEGFEFLGWFDNDNCISDKSEFNFIIKKDTRLEARFDIKKYALNCTASEGGKIECENGKYYPGSKIDLKAIANEGYNFDGWYIDNECISNETSFQYTMPENDVDIEAVFSPILYLLQVTSDNGGSIELNVENNTEIKMGTEISLKLTLKSGYSFLGWYNNDTLLSDSMEFSFNLNGDTIINAKIEDLYPDYKSICTVEDFKNISLDLAGKYVLRNDIDFENTVWENSLSYDEAYANGKIVFSGIFDGLNNSILNISMKYEKALPNKAYSFYSLFGQIKGGTIKNLKISNIDYNYSIKYQDETSTIIYSRIGVLAGQIGTDSLVENITMDNIKFYADTPSMLMAGIVAGQIEDTYRGRAQLSTKIDNCNVKAEMEANARGTNSAYGLLIGYVNGCAVENCNANGKILGRAGSKMNLYAGGAFGWAGANINNCHVDVDVDAAGYDNITYEGNKPFFVGGFVGYVTMFANGIGTITNCSATGDAKLSNRMVSCYVGGFIGQSLKSVLEKNYATGNITGSTALNGLQMGGFGGGLMQGTIVNECYSSGNVTGNSTYISTSLTSLTVIIGGFTGMSNMSTMKNCYSLSSVNVSSLGGVACIGGFIGADTSGNASYENIYTAGNIKYDGAAFTIKIGGFVGFANSYNLSYKNIMILCKEITINQENANSAEDGTAASILADIFAGDKKFNKEGTETIKVENCYIRDGIIWNLKTNEKKVDNGDYFKLPLLTSDNFIKDTLVNKMSFNEDIWDLDKLNFENNIYPTLKCFNK